MNIGDLAKRFMPGRLMSRDVKKWHPNAAFPQPPHQITRDGEVIAKPKGVSKVCLRCNSTNVMPMRMPGFTMYECLKCRHVWRDSFDRPGQVLRPREWRALKPKPWQRLQGRVLI